MVVACSACGKRYKFDQTQLRGRHSAEVPCPNCKASIHVEAEVPGDRTQRLEVDANLLPAHSEVPEGSLSLPPGRRISLAVLDGKDRGQIFVIERPTAILGRGEVDIVLDDSEVSRQHARIEVHGGRVVLRDLESTNGTFVDDIKVTEAEIENRGEFRIGHTRLMLILAETESDPEKMS